MSTTQDIHKRIFFTGDRVAVPSRNSTGIVVEEWKDPYRPFVTLKLEDGSLYPHPAWLGWEQGG